MVINITLGLVFLPTPEEDISKHPDIVGSLNTL